MSYCVCLFDWLVAGWLAVCVWVIVCLCCHIAFPRFICSPGLLCDVNVYCWNWGIIFFRFLPLFSAVYICMGLLSSFHKNFHLLFVFCDFFFSFLLFSGGFYLTSTSNRMFVFFHLVLFFGVGAGNTLKERELRRFRSA